MRDGRFYKFWVYIMGSRTGTLYVGMTGFFDRRTGQHKSGSIYGFTKKYSVDRLLYCEVFSDVGKAKRRELQLKGWRREKKIKLIENFNPRWEDLAEHWGQEMLFRGQPLKRTPGNRMAEARSSGSFDSPSVAALPRSRSGLARVGSRRHVQIRVYENLHTEERSTQRIGVSGGGSNSASE